MLFPRPHPRGRAAAQAPAPTFTCARWRCSACPPADCIAFEDSLAGVTAAKRAGLPVAAVYDRYASHERAQIEALADCTVADYESLVRHFDALTGKSG